ncbi:MAG: hypothetical protein H0V84_01775 [Actinobacteria bacterium]|nr:hypothetical protein [Actinomycetota bacterium]
MLMQRYDESTDTLLVTLGTDGDSGGQICAIRPGSTREEVVELVVNFAFVLREQFIERFHGVWPENLEEIAPPQLCAALAGATGFDDVDWCELAEAALLEAMMAHDARKLIVFLPEVTRAEVVLV